MISVRKDICIYVYCTVITDQYVANFPYHLVHYACNSNGPTQRTDYWKKTFEFNILSLIIVFLFEY